LPVEGGSKPLSTDFLIDGKNWDNIKVSGEVKMLRGYVEVRLGREEG
jgi:hypothetical protein